MSAHKNKGGVPAKIPGIVVGAGVGRYLRTKRFLLVLGICSVAVLLIGSAAGLYLHHKQVRDALVAKQSRLQASVTDVGSIGDPAKLKADSNSLIQGAKDGTYDVSDKQLAQAYAARGDAELNSGDDKAAVADYAKAVQLDPSQQEIVSYGEFLARYRLGERKTLVPLLQQMSVLLKNSTEPQSQEQLATYEQYIADLQNGQDLEL